MAGTCDEVTPAIILATFRSCLLGTLRSRAGRGFGARPGGGFASRLACRRFCGIAPRFAAVALDRTAAGKHHLGIVFLGRARHHGRDVLERMAVGRAQFGGEIDVAAELQHAVVVPLEDGFALLWRQRKAVKIGGLVLLEGLAVLRLHQRHAEHVEVIALARSIRIEHERAGNVIVFLFFGVCFSRRHRRPSMVSDMAPLNIGLRRFAMRGRPAHRGQFEARMEIRYTADAPTFMRSAYEHETSRRTCDPWAPPQRDRTGLDAEPGGPATASAALAVT